MSEDEKPLPSGRPAHYSDLDFIRAYNAVGHLCGAIHHTNFDELQRHIRNKMAPALADKESPHHKGAMNLLRLLSALKAAQAVLDETGAPRKLPAGEEVQTRQ